MKLKSAFLYGILTMVAAAFIFPILFILMNSFKGKLYISSMPFDLPQGELFAGISNYLTGIEKANFLSALTNSFFITVSAVVCIVLFTSMTSWYLVRVKGRITTGLYFMFVFSMIVPFQMIMYTMAKLADTLSLDNPIGLVFLYVGYGAGLSVFMFCGFIKSIPLEIEEAAIIDGCTPIVAFFCIVFPILKPTAITISILNAMWVWNDYLLPYLIIGDLPEYRTIPIAVQYLMGSYGNKDYGLLMALLVLSIIPIVVFYMFCQRYIIEGVVAGAVKG